MNITKKGWNKKAMGGLTVVAVIALFLLSFMFSKPVVTGLVTGNESLNISYNTSLGNISIQTKFHEGLNVEENNNISLNTSIEELTKNITLLELDNKRIKEELEDMNRISLDAENFNTSLQNENFDLSKQVRTLKEELEEKQNFINRLEIVCKKIRDDTKNFGDLHNINFNLNESLENFMDEFSTKLYPNNLC